MKIIDILKYKKEIRKLKKENKKISLELETMQKNGIIRKNDYCIVPSTLFSELWSCYANKPVICYRPEKKETLFYNDKYYIEDITCKNIGEKQC